MSKDLNSSFVRPWSRFIQIKIERLKSLKNTIIVEEYNKKVWPNLEKAKRSSKEPKVHHKFQIRVRETSKSGLG